MTALILGSSFLASVLTWAGVSFFRRWAERFQILDLPNERSSHTLPTPRGGGLVIVAVTLLLGAVCAGIEGGEGGRTFLIYGIGGLLIASVSWLDDLHRVPRWVRFAVHATASAAAIAGITYWSTITLPFFGAVRIGAWGAIITAIWIVGLTNAYNFMDGIDGIAGGQALVAGLAWWFTCRGSCFPLDCLSLLLAATSLGFLLHNWPPASIFMGDVGSAFLGYTLAVLPLIYESRASDVVEGGAPVVGFLFVWPFVFDTAFTFVRRLFRRENVFEAHRSHLYQRLVISGWSHQRVTILYIGLALAGSLPAALWTRHVAADSFSCFAAVALLAASLWILVKGAEHQAASRTRAKAQDTGASRDQARDRSTRGD